MLFDTITTQTAQASLDSLWLKTQVISNNLANVDTPGFKASNVTFEETLSQARKQQNIKGKNANGAAGQAPSFRARITQDDSSSVRIDGNNVVLEREQSELWKTYAQYSYLLDRVAGHYGNISSVVNTMKG